MLGMMVMFVMMMMALRNELRAHIRSEDDFKQDFTSWLLVVEEGIPLSRDASWSQGIEVNLTNTDDIIRTEGVLVLEFNVAKGLIISFEGDGVIPFWVLAARFTDFSLHFSVTNKEVAVRIHLAEGISIMGKLSFNGL